MRSLSVECMSTTKTIIVYVCRIRIILTEQKLNSTNYSLLKSSSLMGSAHAVPGHPSYLLISSTATKLGMRSMCANEICEGYIKGKQ